MCSCYHEAIDILNPKLPVTLPHSEELLNGGFCRFQGAKVHFILDLYAKVGDFQFFGLMLDWFIELMGLLVCSHLLFSIIYCKPATTEHLRLQNLVGVFFDVFS